MLDKLSDRQILDIIAKERLDILKKASPRWKEINGAKVNIKRGEEIKNDSYILLILVMERLNKLPNCYTPIFQRLQLIQNSLSMGKIKK